jgi:hypothetical protein
VSELETETGCIINYKGNAIITTSAHITNV